MNFNKSPGSDGLPVEFYKKFWTVIRSDFMEMVKFVKDLKQLSDSQSLGVIKLIAKTGNLELVENWRPITLLNVDYKIISKVIANRLKIVMDKVISKEQYCGVTGRSIVSCNNTIRDVIHYSKEKDMEMAILSLDWSKAFDRVSLQFVFKVMKKFGFPDEFIEWMAGLYKNCNSRVSVNGSLSSSFNVRRSIRQGCPTIYVIICNFSRTFVSGY